MTWANRLRLIAGLLVVFALVAGLTYVYTERESAARSQTATITATQLPVGTDYGGRVTSIAVAEGDRVAVGDPILTLDSREREEELQQRADDAEAAAERAAEAAEDDNATAEDAAEAAELADRAAELADQVSSSWTVTASAPGTVGELPVGQGGYIPTGGLVAQVFEDDSLAVEAELVLSPRDLDRLADDATVTVQLPDRSEVTGTVDGVEVTTEEGKARAVVSIASAAIRRSDPVGMTLPGTPVVATVDLRDDGPLAGMRDAAADFLARMGLA